MTFDQILDAKIKLIQLQSGLEVIVFSIILLIGLVLVVVGLIRHSPAPFIMGVAAALVGLVGFCNAKHTIKNAEIYAKGELAEHYQRLDHGYKSNK